MKNYLFFEKHTMSLICCMIIFWSCNKKNELTACYNYDKSAVRIDESVLFSNCSKKYNRVEWDFGDGTSSTIAAPSHKWTSAGYYTVKMTAYSKNDKKNQTVSKDFLVAATLPRLSFSVYVDTTLTYYYPNSSYVIYACKTKDMIYHKAEKTFYGAHSINPFAYIADTYPVDDIHTQYKFKCVIYGKSGSSIIPLDSFVTKEVKALLNGNFVSGNGQLKKTTLNYAIQ